MLKSKRAAAYCRAYMQAMGLAGRTITGKDVRGGVKRKRAQTALNDQEEKEEAQSARKDQQEEEEEPAVMALAQAALNDQEEEEEETRLLKAAIKRPLPGGKGKHRQGCGFQRVGDDHISWPGLLRKYYKTKKQHGMFLRCCHKSFGSATCARGTYNQAFDN
ncbi:Hypothetical predicted protein [Mytilus galloprovincialis]|uniref:Uncharacterized protein n=1 Tax=Mytilus galloprovincialis TaxID=29158 RepID=A0A8B6GNR1_MYTGA|nr:Hypothetical predicted protein [Mytilus galloprovincialis]